MNTTLVFVSGTFSLGGWCEWKRSLSKTLHKRRNQGNRAPPGFHAAKVSAPHSPRKPYISLTVHQKYGLFWKKFCLKWCCCSGTHQLGQFLRKCFVRARNCIANMGPQCNLGFLAEFMHLLGSAVGKKKILSNNMASQGFSIHNTTPSINSDLSKQMS